MRTFCLRAILLAAFCLSMPTFAQPDDQYAHMGVSGSLTFASYGGYKKLGFTPLESWICAAATANFLGVLKEYGMDSNPDRRDMFYNAIGSTIPLPFIFAFDL